MCLTVLAVPPVVAGDLYDDYDEILSTAVQGELVDYSLIQKQYKRSLDKVLDDFSRVDPAGLETDDRMAFLINLYNATMIKAVVEHDTSDYSPADDGFKVFKEERVRLFGGTISLDKLENDIIRPDFSDPRIHVALVCGARSCPPILPRAYRGPNLDRELNSNMRAFFADENRNVIDVEKRELRLSQILEWFADDFGGRDHLAVFVDRWVDPSVGGFKVSFITYSWELNSLEK